MRIKYLTSVLLTAMATLLCNVGSVNAQRVFLSVDRETGAASAVSSANLEVDGYSISSDGGQLDPESWNSLTDQGLEGWTETPGRINQIAELKWIGSDTLSAGQPVSLGTPYAGGGPSDEDLEFEYSTPEGVVGAGRVMYAGDPVVPGLIVDRRSGAVEIANPLGFEITGYSIISASDSLSTEGFNGLADNNAAGWFEANLTAGRLSELSLENSQVVDAASPLSVGNAFVPGAAEDLSFEYVTLDGTLAEGLVTYQGPANDLTLQVDLITGAASILNSAISDEFDLVGYAVLSPSGGLSTDAWTSLADANAAGWFEANPGTGALAELNPTGSMNLASGDAINLGNIFAGIEQDLVLEYSTAAGGAAFGTVEYVLNLDGGGDPPTTLLGDADRDNDVDFDDFVQLSNSFGQPADPPGSGADFDMDGTVDFDDFVALSNNFGASAAAAVPEPTTGMLAVVATLGLALVRRRR